MFSKDADSKRTRRKACGVLLCVALLAGGLANSARAADDDDVEWDAKILQNILQGIGLRSGNENNIEYRERSPLVVPANRNLPAPSNKAATEKAPAWPTDQDVKRRKEAKADAKNRRHIYADADSYPLKPGELRSNSPVTSGGSRTTADNSEYYGPMKPSELGYKGGLFSGLLGGAPKEEYTTFTGEAPRSSLIEPPTGYRTPSPYQPYGVGREKWVPPVVDRNEVVR